ncbi:PD-(D/E)XK nuclease family protein [Campylobacter porcelli]|uniref:PD-(D/E)XK nuclease family protein n=2 Tax=Campylobacter TaxID=194 RepID=A0ABU7M305_9BACT|nr:PD-(D/E)XK nuclease family protein [Campylobacter sp. CX2-4855-23]
MIILNRVFSGGYLNDNLGHEVINFFKADNGEHYIYITPYGKINIKAKNVAAVLMVRSVGQGHMEILGYASDLECLISDEFMKGSRNKLMDEEQDKQIKLIKEEKIKYGGKALNELFNEQENTVYVTFKVGSFKKPKQKIYIVNENEVSDNKCYVNFRAKQSLIEYLDEEKLKDSKLQEFLDKKEFWDEKPCQSVDEIMKNNEDIKDVNFFEVIGKEYDELAFSNIISYVLNEDRELLAKFCLEFAKFQMDSKMAVITRETDENIDIYIKDDKHAIVIENKIKSGVNGKKYDEKMNEEIENQLDKYRDFAKIKDKGAEAREVKCILLVPDHHDILRNDNAKKEVANKEYEIITYKKLFKFFSEYKSEIRFYDEFLRALEFHSTDYQNRAYEIAMRRLQNIIKNN